ncbi:large subunit rRNA processing RRM protein, putative [Plasmodium berghei]|uniref:RNA-binding protein 34, putative n=2 Tax=Plasmodium berghei TaxID=5821 RepID=A0A509ADV4_PLABA|nr:RNA-binding protein 34, putative [Plasmodium berghei ANKA]CXI07544.1 large subunit rRNA processing RRM protein, putative [Plasmodium berghei]SCL92617.1 large subunit rRNA processing RRM protein, putative [Plasmodium berghei]SCM15678.1 large subunit rRNA processing RRM protein, putative [Plasmodium berghei]SCM17472.1 large subunit rRNA processing RRM protein, putative [Plasmodium berghei]SCN22835.1 large subunit rRNA processing RRM protein, putative [Plasmodium berghei]|eukprot:XP_034420283.1 RNA-binding protein 34, putative [Plasmodium berghei ANKA]
MEKNIIYENPKKDENCDKNKDSNNGEDVIKQDNLKDAIEIHGKKINDLKRIKKRKNKKNKNKKSKNNESKNNESKNNESKNHESKNVGKNKGNGKGEQINSIVNFLKKNEAERVQKEDIKEVGEKKKNSSLETNPQKKEKAKAKKNDNTDIEEQNDRTVFVGNIPLNDVSNLKLLKILGINKSLVESIRFRSLPLEEKYANKKKLGIMLKKFTDVKDNKNALIRMKRKEDISLLLDKNGTVYNGHVLRINKCGDQNYFSRKKSVCLKNLDRSLSEKDLYELFKDIDEIKGVRILRDVENSQSRGVAFILFKNRASVKTAIKMFNGKEIKDRVITVEKLLKEKENDKNYKSKNDFKKSEAKNFKNFKQKNQNRFKQPPK